MIARSRANANGFHRWAHRTRCAASPSPASPTPVRASDAHAPVHHDGAGEDVAQHVGVLGPYTTSKFLKACTVAMMLTPRPADSPT